MRPQSFPYIPGVDFAGVIESIGADVTVFHVGQEVFGCAWGTYAQYALAPVNYVALKSKALIFDEAATIPFGATTAWQGLFDHGNLQKGQGTGSVDGRSAASASALGLPLIWCCSLVYEVTTDGYYPNG